MNGFFGGGQEGQRHSTGNSDHNQNPVMEFLRNVTGQPAVDAATAAAHQFGDFVSENFPVAQEFVDYQQQNFMDFQQQQSAQPSGPPPASAAALRQLPTISVTAEDLVEPSNRECCICFEENNIHDKVVRLPCAHIFHSECITDWLSRHCTCPTCRYELPTTDPSYEAGRRERMMSRRPRYAKYELERMSIRELKELLPRRRVSSALFSDKTDLVDFLITNKVVDLISAPPPVEFHSSAVLRAMGVGLLKRTMNDTGVYFDPKDVVEKEDMVQIFINSGRICLEEPEETTFSGPDTTYGHAPCTRQRSYSCEMGEGSNSNEDRDGATATTTATNNNSQDSQGGFVVETVGENGEDCLKSPRSAPEGNVQGGVRDWQSDVVMEETGFGSDGQANGSALDESLPSVSPAVETNSTGEAEGSGASIEEETPADPTDEAAAPPVSDDDVMEVDAPLGSTEDATAAAVAANTNGEEQSETAWLDENESEQNRKRQRELEEEQQQQQENQYHRLSISQLKSVARENGVDLSNVLERSEMIERISTGSRVKANGEQSNGSASRNGSLALATDRVQSWTSSQLQICGNALALDISHCENREDIVQLLLSAAANQPQAVNAILDISPMMSMGIKQLRAQARRWNVNVRDCLEKGEILRRLAASAAQRSS